MAVKTHESAEDYLETILMLQRKNGMVRSIDIASEMDFSKPSVSVAMKKLRAGGYIEMGSDGHITLTKEGMVAAESVLERHTMLTDWLIRIGVERSIAADDACRIEHVISAESFEAIKRHVARHSVKAIESGT